MQNQEIFGGLTKDTTNSSTKSPSDLLQLNRNYCPASKSLKGRNYLGIVFPWCGKGLRSIVRLFDDQNLENFPTVFSATCEEWNIQIMGFPLPAPNKQARVVLNFLGASKLLEQPL
ncbi:hypothetical protein CEXT_129121 [Caerostris extrusa]|uniref:Uncharacterized protein n=1 Tax=Caerostris extrusa TaxID=172846 RepID=A0AAV4UEN4_CAEEX|nr:hypothetical protein CEXT_129121 [Caerostris extrusa]